jgi:hypothetical protein
LGEGGGGDFVGRCDIERDAKITPTVPLALTA